MINNKDTFSDEFKELTELLNDKKQMAILLKNSQCRIDLESSYEDMEEDSVTYDFSEDFDQIQEFFDSEEERENARLVEEDIEEYNYFR